MVDLRRHERPTRPLRPLPHRLPPHRRRPHRPLQLALGPQDRRQLPAAHRGHRPGALHPGGGGGHLRRDALAGARLGRGARTSRAATGPTSRPSGSTSTGPTPTGSSRPARPTPATAPRRSWTPAGPRPRRPRSSTATRAPAGRSPTTRRRRHVIRFRVPETGATGWDDLVKGPISTPHETLQDEVILRFDGIPLYNFGVVVDDVTMGDHPGGPRRRPRQQHGPPDPDVPGPGRARCRSSPTCR